MRYVLVTVLLFFCGQVCFSQDSLAELKQMRSALVQRKTELLHQEKEAGQLIDSLKKKIAVADKQLKLFKPTSEPAALQPYEEELEQLRARLKAIEDNRKELKDILVEVDLLKKDFNDRIKKLSKKGA